MSKRLLASVDLVNRIRTLPGWFEGVSGLMPELRTWDRRGAAPNLTEPDSESNAYPRWLSREAHPAPEDDQSAARLVYGFEIRTPSNGEKPRIDKGAPIWWHRRVAEKLPNLEPEHERKRAAEAYRAERDAVRRDRRTEAEVLASFATAISVECQAQQDHDCGTTWKVLPRNLDELGRVKCPTCGELTVVLPPEPAESTTERGARQITRVINPAPVWRKDKSRQGGRKWRSAIKTADLSARRFEDDGAGATDWTDYTNVDAVAWGVAPHETKREQRKGTDIGHTWAGAASWMPAGQPSIDSWEDVVLGVLRAPKAAVLAFENGISSIDPRDECATLPKPPGPFTGRAHASDMLLDAQRISAAYGYALPAWISARLLDVLLDVVSFDAAGDGQIRSDTLRALLGKRAKLARWIRDYADDRASEYTQRGDRRAVTLPYASAVKLLAELHAIADDVDEGPKGWQAKIADLKRSANKKHQRYRESLAWYELLSKRERAREHEEDTIDPVRMMQARSKDRADHAAWWLSREEFGTLGTRTTVGGGFVAQCGCRREHCRCGARNDPSTWAENCSCPSGLRIVHTDPRSAMCLWGCGVAPAVLPATEADDQAQRWDVREIFAEAARAGGAEPISESKAPTSLDPAKDWWWKKQPEREASIDHDAVCPRCWEDISTGSTVSFVSRRLPRHVACNGLRPREAGGLVRYPWQIEGRVFAALLHFWFEPPSDARSRLHVEKRHDDDWLAKNPSSAPVPLEERGEERGALSRDSFSEPKNVGSETSLYAQRRTARRG